MSHWKSKIRQFRIILECLRSKKQGGGNNILKPKDEIFRCMVVVDHDAYIDDQQSIVSTDLYEAFHQEDEFKRKKNQICVLAEKEA